MHDQLFKALLTTFFLEFIELFYPKLAAHINRRSIQFLDKEVFTDVSRGKRKTMDIVAKVRFEGRRAFFLIHIENQATSEREFARRMFEYFAVLHHRYGLPVYPIAILSYDRPKRKEPNQYVVAFPDARVLDFRFRAVQLNRLDWRRFVDHNNPVAAALVAKMSIQPEDRARVKLQCLRLLATLQLDSAKMYLISEFVNEYLSLSRSEYQTFQQELAAEPAAERKAIMQKMDYLVATGWKKGKKEGMRKGQTGFVLTLLKAHLGELSPAMSRKIRQLDEPALLALGLATPNLRSKSDVTKWLAEHA